MENSCRNVKMFCFQNINVKLNGRDILKNVKGSIESGNIFAIMGPSGGGKSTLLNYISFRFELLEALEHSGTVKLNDTELTKKDRYKIGYVMQNDTFFENLTLYETIYFYANLRLPKNYTAAMKKKRIREVMMEMKLEKCANTEIGGLGFTGLSGGEKKRLSIACELITDPPIIFLDEPTSGLDSSTAFLVIDTLEKYCREQNKIVVTTIHQPNSPLFYKFKKLLLLYSGMVAYHGAIENVAEFFKNCGYPCPVNWNAADHIIEVITKSDEDAKLLVQKFSETVEKDDGDDIKRKNLSLGNENNTDIIENENFLLKHDEKKWPAGYKNQFLFLLRRNLMLMCDEKINICVTIQYIIVSLLIGLVWYKIPWHELYLHDILGLLFFINVEIFSITYFSSMFAFNTDKNIVSRERMSSMYRLSGYFLSKVVSEIPGYLYASFLYAGIIYWMAGLSSQPLSVFMYYIVLVISALAGQSWGYFLASFGLNQYNALTIYVIFFVVMNIFGGFYVTRIPFWIGWLRYLSPIYSSFVLQCYFQFSGNSGLTCNENSRFSSCKISSKISVGDILTSVGMNISIGYVSLIFITSLIVLQVLSYVILIFTLTKPPKSFSLIFYLSFKSAMIKKYKPKV